MPLVCLLLSSSGIPSELLNTWSSKLRKTKLRKTKIRCQRQTAGNSLQPIVLRTIWSAIWIAVAAPRCIVQVDDNFYRPQTSLRRLCFHRFLSVHEGRGVSVPLHAGIPPPLRPEADTPLGRHPTWQTPPPLDRYPHSRVDNPSGTHLTGIHSCIQLNLVRWAAATGMDDVM